MSASKPSCLNLPLFSIPPPYHGSSARVRQRHGERRFILQTCNLALASLNSLSTSLSTPQPTTPPPHLNRSVCSNSSTLIPSIFSDSQRGAIPPHSAVRARRLQVLRQ